MTDQRHSHQGLPEFHLHAYSQDSSRLKVARSARRWALAVVVLLLLGLGRAVQLKHANAGVLAERAAQSAVLQVRTIKPGADAYEHKLTLPSGFQGINETQIYARANGYVKQWLKDIGEPVKKGELLAVLDIPEVNEQVAEASANFELAKTAYERWGSLRKQDAVSQQEYDEKLAQYHQTGAALKRLRDTQSFGKVLAPFDGMVTRRNINNGDLVNAGNTGQTLYSIAQIDKLRLYAYVPQSRASRVHIGDTVEILRPEAAAQSVKGRIVHSAGAIDPVTRTLQIEIQVQNTDHSLMPGAYVDVVFNLKAALGLTLPTNALLFNAAGSRVAIAEHGKVRMQVVTLGADYGHDIEIKAGLAPGDKVIMNPPDSISDGVLVAEAAK
jgi:membrane fusion protein, multidrug efflux system